MASAARSVSRARAVVFMSFLRVSRFVGQSRSYPHRRASMRRLVRVRKRGKEGAPRERNHRAVRAPSLTVLVLAAVLAVSAAPVQASPLHANPQHAGIQVALRAFGLYNGPIDG